jgi:hypothetical protein
MSPIRLSPVILIECRLVVSDEYEARGLKRAQSGVSKGKGKGKGKRKRKRKRKPFLVEMETIFIGHPAINKCTPVFDYISALMAINIEASAVPAITPAQFT